MIWLRLIKNTALNEKEAQKLVINTIQRFVQANTRDNETMSGLSKETNPLPQLFVLEDNDNCVNNDITAYNTGSYIRGQIELLFLL